MKLIGNYNNDLNHSSLIKYFCSKSDEVIVVAPFLMPDFNKFFNTIPDKLKKVQLLTTLIPNSPDQIKKVNAIDSFLNQVDKKQLIGNVYLINNLHGKVYIFKKNNKAFYAIVTSANFTKAGLEDNYEWGLGTDDNNFINEIENEITVLTPHKSIDRKTVKKMLKEINIYKKKHKEKINPNIKLDLTKILSKENTESFSTLGNYWLKPYGDITDPVDFSWQISPNDKKLHFSTREPKGVKINDILIVYGVGIRMILSVYKVTSVPMYKKEEKRWPWYVEGMNITQSFTKNWQLNSLSLEYLKNTFFELYSDVPLTFAGGKNYNALMYGHDKIKLNPLFAKYIIEQVLLKTF